MPPRTGSASGRFSPAPGETDHIKVRLVNREGQPVTVLINDLALPDPRKVRSFQVQPVGSPSPLRRPSRDWWTISSPAPGITWPCSR